MMVGHNGKTDELNFKIVCDRELLKGKEPLVLQTKFVIIFS